MDIRARIEEMIRSYNERICDEREMARINSARSDGKIRAYEGTIEELEALLCNCEEKYQ